MNWKRKCCSLIKIQDRGNPRKSLVRITGVLVDNGSNHALSTCPQCYFYTKLLDCNEFEIRKKSDISGTVDKIEFNKSGAGYGPLVG